MKRPTASARELGRAEYEHGREILRSKFGIHRPETVIFTFKKTAEVLFGSFSGNGFRPEFRLGDSEVFVMPGPYDETAAASAVLGTLAARFNGDA